MQSRTPITGSCGEPVLAGGAALTHICFVMYTTGHDATVNTVLNATTWESYSLPIHAPLKASRESIAAGHSEVLPGSVEKRRTELERRCPSICCLLIFLDISSNKLLAGLWAAAKAAKPIRQKTGRRIARLQASGVCGRMTGFPQPRRLQPES